MAIAETGPEILAKTHTIGLHELNDSLIYCLGDRGHALSAEELVNSLPFTYRQAFLENVKNVGFPGKEMERADVAFIDYFFANEHSCITYSYEGERGYVLNDAGKDYYAIMIANEQQANTIPETQPPTDSVVRDVGGGALAAVWAG